MRQLWSTSHHCHASRAVVSAPSGLHVWRKDVAAWSAWAEVQLQCTQLFKRAAQGQNAAVDFLSRRLSVDGRIHAQAAPQMHRLSPVAEGIATTSAVFEAPAPAVHAAPAPVARVKSRVRSGKDVVCKRGEHFQGSGRVPGTVRLLGSRSNSRSCRLVCVGTLQSLWSSDYWEVLGSSCQDLNHVLPSSCLAGGEVFSCRVIG